MLFAKMEFKLIRLQTGRFAVEVRGHQLVATKTASFELRRNASCNTLTTNLEKKELICFLSAFSLYSCFFFYTTKILN